MIKMISPRKLYPTESLFLIEENKILFYIECFKENINDNFRTIGMTTLYDFEAVGRFVYDDYPSC